MVRVNFKNSPPPHEFQAWRVTKCLCLHEPNSFEKMHIRKQLTFLMIWLHNWIVIISNPTFPCWRTNQTCQIQEHTVMNLGALIFGPLQLCRQAVVLPSHTGEWIPALFLYFLPLHHLWIQIQIKISWPHANIQTVNSQSEPTWAFPHPIPDPLCWYPQISSLCRFVSSEWQPHLLAQ